MTIAPTNAVVRARLRALVKAYTEHPLCRRLFFLTHRPRGLDAELLDAVLNPLRQFAFLLQRADGALCLLQHELELVHFSAHVLHYCLLLAERLEVDPDV